MVILGRLINDADSPYGRLKIGFCLISRLG